MKSSNFLVCPDKGSHRHILMPAFYFFIITLISFSQSWNPIGSGAAGSINAMVNFNNELIIAGSFTTAGGVTVNNIARWNGAAYQPLGSGTNGTVYALAIYNNQLIAGGSFTTAGGVTAYRIAAWNGYSWTPISSGTNGDIYALAVHNTLLIAGGAFTTAGGVNSNRIARWNGSAWNYVTYYGFNDNVYALTVFNNDLFAAGRFNASGTYYVMKRIARLYYYSNYYYLYALGSGIDTGTAKSLTVFNNELYIGGKFPTVGGIPVNNIAKWNGTNWSYLGTGVNDTVYSLTNFSGAIIAGGTFTAAGSTIANRVARWNGSAWSTLSTGMAGTDPCVKSLQPWLNVLFAAGTFTTAGGVSVNNIAGWGSLPAAPVLIYPPDGASGISVTPTLTWNPVSGAVSYGVQIARDPNFTNIVVNSSLFTGSQFMVPPGALTYQTTYFWKAYARNGLGSGPWSPIWFFTTTLVGIIDPGEIPLEFKLYCNYPNPFNPSTKIRFDIPDNTESSASIKLVVYNIQGGEVTTLLNKEYIAGKYEATLNADLAGMTSGVYFLKLTAGEYSAVIKIMLVK